MYTFQEYPKWKYHEDGRALIVQTLDGELQLGPGWGDSPAGPFATAEALDAEAAAVAPAVLEDVTANPGSTVKEVAARQGLSEGVAKELLDQLQETGKVERAKFGKYHPMPDALPAEE